MRKIPQVMIIDDYPLFCRFWQKFLKGRYGDRIQVSVSTSSQEALKKISRDVSLILLDWHMPELDGKAFLKKATEQGVGPEKMIIFSGSPVETLHEEFNFGDCLAVIEKGAKDQEEVLIKIFDDLVESAAPPKSDPLPSP
ncbi:MAG: response regulator [Deltaproteobacteria bacterium]|nr:response regulator [Deltaproteobacteria bacterium]MBI4374038.1 response regulator [Deltaproteobacteria bacterium]